MRNRILALQIQHPIPRAHPFRKGKTADRTYDRFTNPRGGSSFATTFIGILNSRFSTDQDFKFLHERMHQRRLVALRDAQKQALIVRKKRANIATRYTRTGRQAADVEEAVSRNEVLQGYVAEWMQKRGMDYTPNTW